MVAADMYIEGPLSASAFIFTGVKRTCLGGLIMGTFCHCSSVFPFTVSVDARSKCEHPPARVDILRFVIRG